MSLAPLRVSFLTPPHLECVHCLVNLTGFRYLPTTPPPSSPPRLDQWVYYPCILIALGLSRLSWNSPNFRTLGTRYCRDLRPSVVRP